MVKHDCDSAYDCRDCQEISRYQCVLAVDVGLAEELTQTLTLEHRVGVFFKRAMPCPILGIF